MKQSLLSMLLLVTLAGCVPPRPPSPQAATITPSPVWRTDLTGTAQIDIAWWRQFGDPALSAQVEAAIANNPDIAIAAARVREARAQEALARAQLFPTLDAGLSASHSRSVSALGSASETGSVQPVFQSAYEVDLFGRIDSQVEAARAAYLASAAARDAATLSVAAATASGYITLLGLDARREVVRLTISSRAEALRLARSRANAGYTSELELRQAEAEYEAAAQILPQVDLAISRQENALSVLTGRAPAAIRPRAKLSGLQAPPLPGGLPSTLLRRRPDIAQAELSLAASDATLDAARAQFLPSLRLTGSAGGLISDALPDPISIWSIGGSILAPLFEGGRLQAGVDTAAARRDQAAFAYKRTTLAAFREVEDALVSVVKLAEQRRSLEAQRAAVAEALRHATNRYQAGYSPYLEQLDAQRSLLNTDLSLVQLRTDQLNAVVSLYQALGGGWGGITH